LRLCSIYVYKSAGYWSARAVSDITDTFLDIDSLLGPRTVYVICKVKKCSQYADQML